MAKRLDSRALAWCITVGLFAFATALDAREPEHALFGSMIFVGLPLAIGLFAVQKPAYEWARRQGQFEKKAWMVSAAANGVYAAALTIPFLAILWLFGTDISVEVASRSMVLLVTCSFATSAVWLCCHYIIAKRAKG